MNTTLLLTQNRNKSNGRLIHLRLFAVLLLSVFALCNLSAKPLLLGENNNSFILLSGSVHVSNNTDCAMTIFCDESGGIFNMGQLYPGQSINIYPTTNWGEVYATNTSTGEASNSINFTGGYHNLQLETGCNPEPIAPIDPVVNENGCISDCSTIDTQINDYHYLGEFEGHVYYKRSSGDVKYWKAKDYAEQLGGYVVTINSQAENDFLQNAVNGKFWIGLTDQNNEGNFAWQNGDPLNYTNWNVGEPNNQGPNSYDADHVRVLDNGKWADDHKSSYYWAVVEIACPCEQPDTNTECDGEITGLQVNPQDGGMLLDFIDGMTFCESDFSQDIRLRANVSGNHESLLFTITGATNITNTENHETYDSNQFWANPGTYQVNIQLYSEGNLGGTLCDEKNYTFHVSECTEPIIEEPNCTDFSVDISNNNAISCDGGSTTISATTSGGNACSDILNYYKVVDTDPTCEAISGQGVIFRRADDCNGAHEPWTAGNDLYFTEYTNGTAILAGSIHNGNQTGTVYIEYNEKATSGQNWNASCYIDNVSVAHYYTSFGGIITVDGTDYTVEPKTSGTDFLLGNGAGNSGNNFGIGGWTAGTWGGCTEFLMDLVEQTIPNQNSDINYVWSGPNGFSSNEQNITVSESGIYTVTATDCANCSNTDEIEISIQNATTEINITGEITCQNASAELSGSTSFTGNGISYSWSGPNGFTANEQNITISEGGEYTLTASQNDCTASATTTVSANTDETTATAEISITGEITCQNASVQLSGTSSFTGNGISYSWTGPNNFSANEQNITVSQGGEYTFTASQNTCTASATETINANIDIPTASANNNGPFSCETTTVQLSASEGASYEWVGPNGFSSTEQNPTVTTAGVYSLTIISENGCIANANTTVTEEPCLIDLELSKTVDKPVIQIGETAVWTITVKNEGPSDATGVTVTDALPDGLELTNIIVSNGTFNPTTATWNIGSLLVGQTENIQIMTLINSEGEFTNTAQVATANEQDVDSTPGNDDGDQSEDDEDSASITVELEEIIVPPIPVFVDVELTKTVDQNMVIVGDQVTWTIQVNNEGPSTATGISVTDVLPAGISFESANPSQGEFNANNAVWTIGTLEVGQSETIDILTTVNEAGTFVNTSQVSATNEDDIDSTPDNDDGDQSEDDEDNASITSVEEEVIEPPVFNFIDLDLNKTVDQEQVEIGGTAVWTITVTNEGPGNATGVSVGDLLPTGLSYVDNDVSIGNFDEANLIWAIGNLNVDQSETLTITTTADQAGTFTNVAQILTHNEDDIDSSPGNDDGDQSEDDEDWATIIVPNNAEPELIDLGLVKMVSQDEVTIGEEFTYTITINNEGPGTATDVTVSDAFPAGIEVLDATVSTGDIDLADLNWLIGTLAVDQTETLTITAMATAAGSFTNTAQVASAFGNDLDSTPGNDDGDQNEDDEDFAVVNVLAGTPPSGDLAGLGNFTFQDLDNNGMYDPTFESPVVEVPVYLYNATDLETPIDSVLTNDVGFYEFTNLDPALDYVVRFGEVAGFNRSNPSFPSSEGEEDKNDADTDTGFTDIIDLEPGEFDPTIDAGYVPFRGFVSAFVFLGGPVEQTTAATTNSFQGFEMRSDLLSENLIPSTEPYSDMEGFTHIHGGGETIEDDLFLSTENGAIVDWVFVELRDPANPKVVVSTRSALVRSSGQVVDINGSPEIEFIVKPGNYLMAIKHRNHLSIMAVDPVELGGPQVHTIDFRTAATTTYGLFARQEIATDVFAMWGGDGNGDEQLIYAGQGNDLNTSFFEVVMHEDNVNSDITFSASGYNLGDFQLNCLTQYQGPGNDANLMFFTILGHPGNETGSLNFTVNAQLPQE